MRLFSKLTILILQINHFDMLYKVKLLNLEICLKLKWFDWKKNKVEVVKSQNCPKYNVSVICPYLYHPLIIIYPICIVRDKSYSHIRIIVSPSLFTHLVLSEKINDICKQMTYGKIVNFLTFFMYRVWCYKYNTQINER